MIRFGLRLTLTGGREAAVRLVVIAAAMALGTGLLLTTLAGLNAVNAQNARYAWLSSGVLSPAPAASTSTQSGTSARDPLWWVAKGDYFDAQPIGRLDVAATGPDSPVPPGIPHLPEPGQFYASPALGALLHATPNAQLGDRYPGREIGTIGSSALPAPNSLIIIIGHTPAELSHVSGATQVTSISTTQPNDCGKCVAGINANGVDLILSVVACALLFPLLMFIGTATRLAAARREQRFAAMRLVGATPRQISVIAAVESTVAAAAGVVVGFGLFFLLRIPVAGLPFTGAPFYPSDLSLGVADVLAVAIGVPVAAAVVARIALRRVRISPLGVTRRVTSRPPQAYRLVLLAAGLGELAYFVDRRPPTTSGQIQAYVPGILLTMAGLVIAGPWLTMVGSRVTARFAKRPATLIAARRLADNPQAGFRAVGGLVLALFVASVAVGVIATYDVRDGYAAGSGGANTLSLHFHPNPRSPAASSAPRPSPPGLRSIAGVQGVVTVYMAPVGSPLRTGRFGQFGPPDSLAACADIARAPDLGRCPAGADVAWVYDNVADPDSSAVTVWPAAAVSVESLRRLPTLSIVVSTNGSTTAIEQARTVLEAAYPDQQVPATDADFRADQTRTSTQYQQLANVVILSSLAIAGFSLAVSLVGGLNERKRPFSLLRLTGTPLRMLRRVVVLETAVPLLASAAVAMGSGFLAAHLFLKSQIGMAVRPPGLAYYVIVAAGLAVSLGIIASTLPLLRRITGPETARNE